MLEKCCNEVKVVKWETRVKAHLRVVYFDFHGIKECQTLDTPGYLTTIPSQYFYFIVCDLLVKTQKLCLICANDVVNILPNIYVIYSVYRGPESGILACLLP